MHTCTLYLFLCLPDGCLRRGAQQDRREENNIYTQTSYMCDSLIASVVIRLLFIRCIKSTRNSSKLTAVVFSAGSPTTSNSDTIQYLPDLSSLFVMAVPCCVFSSKGPSLSLSPCPSLLLLKCVISPSHHHRASKNCAPIDFFFLFKFPARVRRIPSRKEKSSKKGKREKKKKT